MIRLDCPVCGHRDETEFAYLGDATVRRPDPSITDPGTWADFVFLRDNPRGAHCEYWQHVMGCREWLIVNRNTATHQIDSCQLARSVFAGEGTMAASS